MLLIGDFQLKKIGIGFPILYWKPAHWQTTVFDATDGDVIKSQNLFAIYDAIIGWNGTLSYLEADARP
jgi:hypothetical protein